MGIIEKASAVDIPAIKAINSHLHGHTEIMLHNVLTGKYEKVEHDNTFTDGLESYCRSLGRFCNSPWDNDTVIANPQWQTLLGGLFLFDTALPENSKYMPAGTTMVGNASYGVTNTSDPTEMGSWNETESSYTVGKSLTMVYDFTASQANGTIASCALTTIDGGYIGYGNKSGTYSSTLRKMRNRQVLRTNIGNGAGNLAPILYEDKFYYYTSGVYLKSGVSEATFQGVSLLSDRLNVLSQGIKSEYIGAAYEDSITFSFDTLSTDYYMYVHCEGKCIATPNASIAYGGTTPILVMDFETGEVTTYTYTNNVTANGSGVTFGKLEILDETYALGVVSSDSTQMYLVNWKTSAVVGKTSGTGGYIAWGQGNMYNSCYTRQIMKLGGEDLFLLNLASSASVTSSSYGYKFVYDRILNRIIPTSATYEDGYEIFCGYSSKYDFAEIVTGFKFASICHLPQRLMTNNNLDSAVTKTSAQTMKVTYTVTSAE